MMAKTKIKKDSGKYLEIDGKSAKKLDVNICKKIYEIICF